MLTLECHDGRSILDACGSIVTLEDALARALPPGCCVANVYLGKGGAQARVRLGIDDVAAMAALRDDILLGDAFENTLNEALPRWRLVQRVLKRVPEEDIVCLLYTSPSPRDLSTSRMPSSA